MQALILSLILMGQTTPASPSPAEIPPPPSPAESIQSVEEMRAWLLSKLAIDMEFDVHKTSEVRQLLETMNEPQMRALITAYKQKASERPAADKTVSSQTDQRALAQAKLDLQQAQAYRDHLKREYDRQILQGMMMQNLFYQNLIGNQRLMSLNSSIGYSSYLAGPVGFNMSPYGAVYYGVGNTAVGIGVPLNYGPSPWIQSPGFGVGF